MSFGNPSKHCYWKLHGRHYFLLLWRTLVVLWKITSNSCIGPTLLSFITQICPVCTHAGIHCFFHSFTDLHGAGVGLSVVPQVFPGLVLNCFFKTGFLWFNCQFFEARAAIMKRLLHATVKSLFKTGNCFKMKRRNSSVQLCCLPLCLKSVCRTRWLLCKNLKRLDLDALGAFVTAVWQILV